MFLGREQELRSLGELLEKPTSSLIACRGRRRIGKSTLFKEFARREGLRFIMIEGLGPRKGQQPAAGTPDHLGGEGELQEGIHHQHLAR